MALPAKSDIVTAAVLVIGDEILSGRTQDQNSQYIGCYLGYSVGIACLNQCYIPIFIYSM